MEWDSDRYHECYFAMPMMGAVMQTVNVSLTPDDIAYTINDTRAKAILFNIDFLPLIEKHRRQAETVEELRRDARPAVAAADRSADEGRIRGAAGGGLALFPVPRLRRERLRDDFPHDGHDRPAERRLFQPSPDGAAHARRTGRIWRDADQGRFHRDDVYMPLTPMFHVHAWGCPYTATLSGAKLVFPGRYAPDVLLQLIQTRR